jgi:ssDNA-binding Zn-finger/Zn-ribbon topoisomerase 1
MARSDDDRPCPKCGSRMVLRTAKRGARAGERFWGCERYPACKATAPEGVRIVS